jgi:hypothetical protein
MLAICQEASASWVACRASPTARAVAVSVSCRVRDDFPAQGHV